MLSQQSIAFGTHTYNQCVLDFLFSRHLICVSVKKGFRYSSTAFLCSALTDRFALLRAQTKFSLSACNCSIINLDVTFSNLSFSISLMLAEGMADLGWLKVWQELMGDLGWQELMTDLGLLKAWQELMRNLGWLKAWLEMESHDLCCLNKHYPLL